MKTNLIYGLFLLSSIVASAQISTTRMNDLKIGMSSSDILKLQGNKPAAIASETEFKLKHNGIEFTAFVGQGYLSGDEQKDYLKSISTTSKSIKTISGLGVGSSLDDLWKAYSDKYNIYLNKTIENLREFTIEDEKNGTRLTFFLQKEVVIKIEINSYNPEECFL